MDTEIPKAYDPKTWEDDLYRKWEESGFFNPDVCIEKGITDATKPTYSIVLPPPNVTGTLHAGHAAMLAIEDTVVRYHRMKRDRTLWLPGTDHAAIATQSKVEKLLMKEEGKNRHDLGRDEFLARVERFAADSHDTIVNQCKKMGSSLDWSREAYTLDEKRSLAVRTAFKKMYDDGLIYRGYRPVNWSVKGQSTCSDDELVSVDRKATLSTFKYSKDFPVAIATTRPETKLGDTAVAVHPNDGRYKELVGKTFIIDSFAGGPKLSIKIIADEMIDPTFGTGAVGITPAHSHTDYDFYLRHKESDEVAFAPHGEPVIGTDGKMTAAAGKTYARLSVFEAREKVIASLRSSGLLESETEINQSVGTSDRYEDVVEVIPMKQWFIDVNKEFDRDGRSVSLKQLMQESVSSGRVTILPDRFAKTYFHWIDNLRDWCISRQIWFGHRIPVWYRGDEIFCSIDAPEGEGWGQDPDTLDTWFSSGLWTFSTLGWPTHSQASVAGRPGCENDFANYHPTNLLETGYDILFFWVARMILMTEYLIGTHPFDTVYLHGLVRDGEGRKMSKSLGNTIDPLTVSEEHGADALRMALMSGATPGNDMKLSGDKIVSMRNFTNKLWNIARYVGSQSTVNSQQSTEKPEAISDADHNLIAKLERVTASITRHLDGYELSLATEELRAFTWDDFADWYVEVHKIEKNDALLRHAFDTILKLWHPFMPFVTEAIHQTLHLDKSEFLMVAKWPTHSKASVAGRPVSDSNSGTIENANRFELVKDLIVKIRNIRSIYHIDPGLKMVVSTRDASEHTIRNNEEVFKRLARVSEVRTADTDTPEHTLLIQSGLLQALLHLDGAIDIESEKMRIGKELAETEKYAASLQAKLTNKNFVERAKPEIVEQTKSALSETSAKISELREHIASLS